MTTNAITMRAGTPTIAARAARIGPGDRLWSRGRAWTGSAQAARGRAGRSPAGPVYVMRYWRVSPDSLDPHAGSIPAGTDTAGRECQCHPEIRHNTVFWARPSSIMA